MPNPNRRAKIIYLLFGGGAILIALSFIAVFKPNSSDNNQNYGGIYRYAISEILSPPDPRRVVFNASKNVLSLIYDSLINVSDDMELVPAICSYWTMINKNHTFVCHIKPNIHFHNGKELLSRDVAFSIEYMARKGGLDLDSDSLTLIEGMSDYRAGYSKHISGIRIPDNYTIFIDLNVECPHFAYIISSPRFVILPDNFNGQTEEEFFKQPVGTGPFEYVSMNNDGLIVRANNDYFGGRPYIDELRFQYYPSKGDAIRAFIRNEVDDLGYYYLEELPDGISNAEYVLSSTYSNIIVFPNNSRKPFNDNMLRRLLFSAIDRENVVRECYPRSSLSNTIIPRGIIGYDDNAVSQNYDFENAKSILDRYFELYKKIMPAMVYTTEADLNLCAYTRINENFRRLGLPWALVYVTSDNLGKYFFDGSMDAEIEMIGVKNEDAYNILRFFSSDNAENLARINDHSIDHLLSKIGLETNPFQRVNIYRDIDQRIRENNYAYPIVSPNAFCIWSKRYKKSAVGAVKTLKDFTKISLISDDK